MNPEELRAQYEELQKKLSDPEVLRDPQKVKEYSIAFSKIEKQLVLINELARINRELQESQELAGENDEELRTVALRDIEKLQKEKEVLEKKLSGKETEIPQSIIMEIRAGAGGDEASIFAYNLFEMYKRFAEKKGWETILLDESKNSVGGYKEVVFEINGDDVYKTLRFESGVHRVQRTPATEKMGRIHTSTASVAVLPKATEVDLEIRPEDIKVEFFRSSGPGGQNVNKVETAVRIYHLPTGLIVASQEGRSQQKNRERAMEVLRSRLLQAKIDAEAKKMAAERRQQIGTGDRSEKIRTYNFPQDRVTDHRIKESWHNIESIMAGNIDQMTEDLQNLVNVAG